VTCAPIMSATQESSISSLSRSSILPAGKGAAVLAGPVTVACGADAGTSLPAGWNVPGTSSEFLFTAHPASQCQHTQAKQRKT
jgi:hypothetical protein